MQKEFSLNIIILLAINLLIKPFFIFGIDRTVQNIVGTEQYGIYFTLLSFAYILQILNDFGIQNFNSREISQNRSLVLQYLPNILILKTVLAVVFLIGIFLLGGLAGYAQYYHLLFFLGLNQVLVSLIFYLRSNLTGLGHFRTDSLLSAFDKLLMIIFCAILLWVSPFQENFKIEWFVYAQTVALAIAALTVGFFVGKNLPQKISYKFDFQLTFSLLKRSFPFALVILLTTIYTRVDVIMIEKMLVDGTHHAGVYGAAYRLLDASNMVGYLFATLLLPMLSRMLKKGEDVNQLVGLGFRLIFSCSVALAASIFFFQEDIMNLLYQDATPYWGEVLGWLMFTFVVVAGAYVYGSLLLADGDLHTLNKIFGLSIILNMCLNYFLIPILMAEGAAIATLVTQLFVLIFEMILGVKKKLIRTNWKLIVKAITFFLGCLIISYTVSNIQNTIWLLLFIITFSLNLILAIGLKILKFRELLK